MYRRRFIASAVSLAVAAALMGSTALSPAMARGVAVPSVNPGVSLTAICPRCGATGRCDVDIENLIAQQRPDLDECSVILPAFCECPGALVIVHLCDDRLQAHIGLTGAPDDWLGWYATFEMTGAPLPFYRNVTDDPAYLLLSVVTISDPIPGVASNALAARCPVCDKCHVYTDEDFAANPDETTMLAPPQFCACDRIGITIYLDNEGHQANTCVMQPSGENVTRFWSRRQSRVVRNGRH